MSGGLTFLSWVRTGLISGVAPAAAGGNLLDAPLPRTATLPVTLALDGGGEVRYDARVAGPGDVVGLDGRQVIRMDPTPGATEVEPNYFALVEFDRPDVPWMLTPNTPAEDGLEPEGGRRGLRPWLCLVVVPDQALDPPTGARPLPRLSVSSAELPDLEEAWLWAHAQVLAVEGKTLEDALANHPERTLSRLVSPRRLKPSRGYLACVVPTFEAGRRAGLGLEPAPGETLSPAWTHGDGPRPVHLPVYHHWRFSTSRQAGDFEALAARLQPTRFGLAGVRPLDVGHAGAGLPGPAEGEQAWELGMEGVIVGGQVNTGGWGKLDRERIQGAIARRLASSDEELAPPTYGSLQGSYPGSLEKGRGPAWLRGLNLDPRYRATASLGTRLVQQHQEALMASAWEQSAGIREANRMLRQAQLARAVGETLRERVTPSAADRLLQMTAPAHNQVGASTGAPTVATAIAPNAAVEAAVSVPFRRIARPRGPLARRLSTVPLPAPVVRLGVSPHARAALRPTPVLKAIPGTPELGKVSATENFGTLDRARVEAPELPWETGAPTRPRKVPHGYLADLVVNTVERGEADWQPKKWTTSVAKGLDFDGVPQLGWEVNASPPTPGVGTDAWYEGYASTFVEMGDRRGLLGVVYAHRYAAGLNWYEGSIGWTPGYLLEGKREHTKGSAAGPMFSYHPGGLAVAALDITAEPGLDAVVIWSNRKPGWGSPPSRPDVRADSTYLAVGRNLNPATGSFEGGWSAMRPFAAGSGPFSAAGSGRLLFFLAGRTLRVDTLNADGSSASSHDVDLGGLLPEDYVSGALAAADFGGGTGVDLLVYFVAGRRESLRAGYRIAYDVRANGSVGRWGEVRTAPVPSAGGDVSILVGAAREATETLRRQKTDQFRTAAGLTQDRQKRIFAKARPPAPAPGVNPQVLAADVRGGIDPAGAITEAVGRRLVLSAKIEEAAVRDVLQPLALTPRFPYPTYELFRDSWQDRLFPGASRMPDDCVTALRVNRAALEAFLVGLNHEMSRELLWRGFPVRHGTFFREFWDARREEITPIEEWGGEALGAHGPAAEAEGSLLLVVRAELIRRIPNVTLYAVPAEARPGGRAPRLDRRVDPLFSGRIDPGIRFFGFNLPAAKARGDDGGAGWYFVFQEHPTAPRFGLNEAAAGAGTRPLHWGALEWPQVARTRAEYDGIAYARAGAGAALTGTTLHDFHQAPMQHRWGFSAAHMAHITLQRPVQVAIHASDLIAPEDPEVGP